MQKRACIFIENKNTHLWLYEILNLFGTFDCTTLLEDCQVLFGVEKAKPLSNKATYKKNSDSSQLHKGGACPFRKSNPLSYKGFSLRKSKPLPYGRALVIFRASLNTQRAERCEGFFRQTKQKSARIVDPMRKNFVTYDGKSTVISACDEFLEMPFNHIPICSTRESPSLPADNRN